jgi:glutathione S-transferase
LGERFSAADVMLGSVVALAERLKLNESFPRLQAYAKRLTARPAFQKSRAAT